jgi:hypothetical protein
MEVFLQPKWNATEAHYVIETTAEFRSGSDDFAPVKRDTSGSTVFTDEDQVHNITDDMVQSLIDEGASNNWFAKLPSHEQLMKRVRHTFAKLAAEKDTHAVLTTILMTPKALTFLWTPTAIDSAPAMYFEDSEESEPEPQIEESNLPAVALRNTGSESQEEYLLTRLRAAKARVETEQIRMQYFEATGRMPPDSESEDE